MRQNRINPSIRPLPTDPIYPDISHNKVRRHDVKKSENKHITKIETKMRSSSKSKGQSKVRSKEAMVSLTPEEEQLKATYLRTLRESGNLER